MKTVKDALSVYRELSFGDRLIFYLTLSSDIDIRKDTMQEILEEARPTISSECYYCHSLRIVRNGHRKDGTQRYLCRDCRRSFTNRTDTFLSGSHKQLDLWMKYLLCMTEKKTLKESAMACGVSMGTAFAWRHKILAALKPSGKSVCLAGVVEADETYFNVSYKGNHTNSKSFEMPREPHKRGSSVHAKGLSSEKVCVACAVNTEGTALSGSVKTGKVSTECLTDAFGERILSGSVLCTDNEKAYIGYATDHRLRLVQMETDRRTKDGCGIQRINAYHSKLKNFTRIFRGVSSKYLDHYLTWHDRLLCSWGEVGEQLHAALDLCLSFGKHICRHEFPQMPALPGRVVRTSRLSVCREEVFV